MAAENKRWQRLQQAGPLTWLLAACCGWALLLWLATLAGMGGHLRQLPLAQPAALPKPKPRTADRVGPLSQYAEAAERPLFTEDRRPQAFLASTGDGEGAPAQALDFVLTGVLISPQVQLAILQPRNGGEAQRVRVGATVEGASGWRLQELKPRQAIFEGAGGRLSLDLRSFGVEAGAANARADDSPDGARGAADDMPPPPSREQAARLEEIRRRIAARRAELRRSASSPDQSRSTPPPPPPPKDGDGMPVRANLQPVKED